jgi:hypothetical protein
MNICAPFPGALPPQRPPRPAIGRPPGSEPRRSLKGSPPPRRPQPPTPPPGGGKIPGPLQRAPSWWKAGFPVVPRSCTPSLVEEHHLGLEAIQVEQTTGRVDSPEIGHPPDPGKPVASRTCPISGPHVAARPSP